MKLFGVAEIPTDPQVRNLLDPLEPSLLSSLFPYALKLLEEHGGMANYKSYAGQTLISLDGTETISSQNINCKISGSNGICGLEEREA